MKKIYIAFLVAALAGCASMNQASIIKYDYTYYPSKPDSFNIRILDRQNITDEFRVIAQVSDDVATIYDSQEQVLKNMRAAARSLGGDALIDLETETIDTSYDWIPSQKTVYKAKVIVFTGNNHEIAN